MLQRRNIRVRGMRELGSHMLGWVGRLVRMMKFPNWAISGQQSEPSRTVRSTTTFSVLWDILQALVTSTKLWRPFTVVVIENLNYPTKKVRFPHSFISQRGNLHNCACLAHNFRIASCFVFDHVGSSGCGYFAKPRYALSFRQNVSEFW